MRLQAEAGGRRVPIDVRGSNGRYELSIGGRALVVDARRVGDSELSLLMEGRSYDVAVERTAGGFRVHVEGRIVEVVLREATAAAASGAPAGRGPARLEAPMPGKVVRVLVAPGVEVLPGTGLVVVEAMKMENELKATRAGRVRAVHVAEGQAVESGALLVEME